MRILHVNYTFGVVGGTETYMINLIRDLAERGYHSEVAAERDDTDGTIAPFHELPETITAKKRWWLRHGLRFRAIVRQAKPDLIYIHNTMNGELVRLATRLRPAIRYVHDHTAFCPGLNKLYADGSLCDRAMGDWCIEKYRIGGCFCFRHPTEELVRYHLGRTLRAFENHRRLKKVIVASGYMEDEMTRAGYPADGLVVNPYYTTLPDETASTEAPDEPPLLLTLCRLSHPDKGVMELLDAIRAIDVPFRARIVGTGDHGDMMKARATELGLDDRLEFAGFVPHERALKMMREARVIAFPSMWNEPFGIVGLEAMAREKPVVAFDIGGVREWLTDGATGTIVPRGDTAAYAAAISRYLTDPALAAAHGAAGPDRVRERFVRDRHLDALEQVFRDAVA